MKVLIVGSGGREHALAWKASKSDLTSEIYVAPGNGGTALESNITNVEISAEDIDGLLAFALKNKIAYYQDNSITTIHNHRFKLLEIYFIYVHYTITYNIFILSNLSFNLFFNSP